MPNKPEEVKEFFERLTKLEVQMENVMSFQKWQTALLAALIIMACKAMVLK